MDLFSPGHLIVVLVVALFLFFGWKQLPDMAKSLGRSLREFKDEIKTDDPKRAESRVQPATPAIEAPRADAAAPSLSKPGLSQPSLSQPSLSKPATPAAQPVSRPRPSPRPQHEDHHAAG